MDGRKIGEAVYKAEFLSCSLVWRIANQLELGLPHECPASAPASALRLPCPAMPRLCPTIALRMSHEPFEAAASLLLTIIWAIGIHFPRKFVAPNSFVYLLSS